MTTLTRYWFYCYFAAAMAIIAMLILNGVMLPMATTENVDDTNPVAKTNSHVQSGCSIHF